MQVFKGATALSLLLLLVTASVTAAPPGEFPLHAAIRAEDLDRLTELLQAGHDPDVGVCTSLPTTPHLVVGRSACRVGVGPSLNRSWAQRSRPVVQAGRRAFPGDESVVD